MLRSAVGARRIGMGLGMTNFKAIFLGGTASLAVASAASAADLPTKKAAPAAEYVKVCTTFGAGYFTIPGSDTCLKIGGVVRYEANVRSNAPIGVANQFGYNLAGQVYSRDAFFTRGRAYLNVDARSQTDYGDLRAYFSFRDTNDSLPPGPFGGGKIAFTPPSPIGSKISAGYFQGLTPAQAILDQGYFHWAGLQGGIAHSFFDFYTHGYELQSAAMGVSDQILPMFGYTAKFGGGFSASVSAEDPRARQIGDSTADVGANNNIPKNATTAAYLTYGAIGMPEWVGNLRYDGGWGSAQISGALHEVNSSPLFDTVPGTLPVGFKPSTVWGYAVNGGVKVKLDALAPGDGATLQVSYDQGAMDYVNALNYWSGTSNVYSKDQSVGVPVNDAFVLPNGSIALSKAFGVFAGLQHYWAPSVRSSLFGSYLQISNPDAAQNLSAGADNARVWDVGVNAIWSPVKALDIGAEAVYTNLRLSGLNTLKGTLPNGASLTPYIPSNSNDLRARLRVQMTF